MENFAYILRTAFNRPASVVLEPLIRGGATAGLIIDAKDKPLRCFVVLQSPESERVLSRAWGGGKFPHRDIIYSNLKLYLAHGQLSYFEGQHGILHVETQKQGPKFYVAGLAHLERLGLTAPV